MFSHRPLILIVDDESKIRRLVAANLEKSGFDVCTAGDGEEALETFMRLSSKPDLIILDQMMPGMDGIAFLEALRRVSAVPVIMLSALDAVSEKGAAFRNGADDYLTKPFSIEELEMRIHAVLRRTRSRDGTASDERRNGPLSLSMASHAVTWNGEPVKLAETEFKLLAALMRRPGAVMTHDELLRVVWGSQAIGELNTLRVAMARLRRRLGEAGVDPAVVSNLSGVGYMLADLSDWAAEEL